MPLIQPERSRTGSPALRDVRHGVGDRVEDQLDLQLGQAGAQAVVRAEAAEAQVGVRVAEDVEPLRAGRRPSSSKLADR